MLVWGGVLLVFLFFACGVSKEAGGESTPNIAEDQARTGLPPVPVTVSGQVYYVRRLLADRKWIVHAAGFMEGADGGRYSYTNSKDALESCYEKGNVISEIDFRISSDDCLVCTHEWTMMYKDGLALPDRPVTKDEFLECRTCGGFTSMWLGDLVAFLEEHNDFYFITDIKDDNVRACGLIAEFCPEWKDHFIIQMYHADEYEPIRALGFQNIIYTLYATAPEEREVSRLLEFADTHELVGYTYWHYWTDVYLGKFLDARIVKPLEIFDGIDGYKIAVVNHCNSV